MVNQIGSKLSLEEYYEKSILEIRDEFKPLIKDQLHSSNAKEQLQKM
ncbi:MAG: hypothetical protein IPG39_19865 [Bacteroidetes bacterium]|nr:hypothetical protein [Bacteroidota bacterium]